MGVSSFIACGFSGACGHAHDDIEAAHRCVLARDAELARVGVLFNDWRVWRIEDGRGVPLSYEEQLALSALALRN